MGEFFIYDMHRLCLVPIQGERRKQNLPAVSPDGQLLAVGHWQGPDTHLWDVPSGKLAKKINSKLAKVAFSPDGQMLAVNWKESPGGRATCCVEASRVGEHFC